MWVIDVDIASMSCMVIYSFTDYDLNILLEFPLQIAPGMYFVIDKTGLMYGQLSECFVKNLHALRSLETRAVIPVDFKCYDINMEYSGSIILMSQANQVEGDKN